MPIPLELVLIPFMVARPERIWLTAAVVTGGCLAGATVGYGLGFFLFESVGQWLIEQLQWHSELKQFRGAFDQYGFWAIVAVGITPLPFQIAMLGAGAAGYSFLGFLAAAAIARGIRYFGLALLVVLFRDRALDLWSEHSRSVGAGLLVVVLLAAGLYILVR